MLVSASLTAEVHIFSGHWLQQFFRGGLGEVKHYVSAAATGFGANAALLTFSFKPFCVTASTTETDYNRLSTWAFGPSGIFCCVYHCSHNCKMTRVTKSYINDGLNPRDKTQASCNEMQLLLIRLLYL